MIFEDSVTHRDPLQAFVERGNCNVPSMHAKYPRDRFHPRSIDGRADVGRLASVLTGDLAGIDGTGGLGGFWQGRGNGCFIGQTQGGLQQGVQLLRAAPEVVAVEEGEQGLGILVIRMV